jgi:hypothetical protein
VGVTADRQSVQAACKRKDSVSCWCHAIEIKNLNLRSLETTTLTITAVVDIWSGTDVGTLGTERFGNTGNCKGILPDILFVGYLGLLPRG